jgi:hypothetical protein
VTRDLHIVEIDRIVVNGAVPVEAAGLGPAVEHAVARELAGLPLPSGRTVRSLWSLNAAAADVPTLVARGVAGAIGGGRSHG